MHLTVEEIFNEYIKCFRDPIYAIETYLTTFDKTQEGFVPFKLYPKQKEIISAYTLYRFNLITKPRQAGISTTTAAYEAVKAAFADKDNPETILILANKQDMAQEFLAKIKDFLLQLPRWVWGAEYYGTPANEKKSIFIKDSQKEIKLPNGSRIKGVATSKDALRGYMPTMLIMDEAAFIENGDITFAAALTALGTGGNATLISCVTKDTFVFTSEGIKEISEFIDETKGDNPNLGYNIQDYSIQGLSKTRTSNLFVNNGLQETIKLESTSGNIEGTHTHKLWCYSKSENKFDWYEMSKLNEGDYINIQSGFELYGNYDEIEFDYKESNKENNIPIDKFTKITTDLAYLIGLYISEGSVYKKIDENNNHVGTSITITCGDDVSEAISSCGFNYSSHDNLHYTIGSKYLGSLLEYLGFDLTKKASEKIIPPRLLKMSRENIIAMLQGIMDADGYSDSIRGRIGISMSSKRLINQIRMLFLNFGILTDYSEGVTPITKKVKVTSKFYRISAISNNAKKYYDLIGFRFNRKQIKNLSLPIFNNVNQSEFIPNGKQIIREIIDDFNLVRKLTGTGLKVNCLRLSLKNKTYDLNKNKFIEFINYFEKTLSLDLSRYNIDKILLLNGKWEKIKNIKYSKNKTYDFSLPNDKNDFWCHSVIYNGILGHQTPNGMDPLYYKTYEQSKKGRNDFHVTELKWYQDPRYHKNLSWLKKGEDDNGEEIIEEELPEVEFTDESFERMIRAGYRPTSPWYEEMCRGMNNNSRMIAQELDVSFIGSGDNVIAEKDIEFQETHNVRDPKWIAGHQNEIWIWERPIEGHEYMMGVDVSRGDADDTSTISIIDVTTMEQVMEYQGKTPPDLLAQLVYDYGMQYNAYTVIDITGGLGVTTILKLVEMRYPHLHYEKQNTKVLAKKKELQKLAKDGDKMPGFNIGVNRLPLVQRFEMMVRTNGIKIRSVRTTEEMKTFIYNKMGRPDHMSGYHDDCLKENTLIKTSNGYTPIQNISVGDLVMTHKGRYKPVEAILKKPFNGEWYDMSFQGQLDLGLSYNHPLYAAPNSSSRQSDESKEERAWIFPSDWGKTKNWGSVYKDNSCMPRQISIKEKLSPNINKVLLISDYFTPSKYETNINLKELTLDVSFSKFLGLFLADGHANKNDSDLNNYTMSLAFNVKDEDLLCEMEQYLSKIGVSSFRTKVKGNSVVLIFTSKLLWYILSDCYDNDRNKKIPHYYKHIGEDLSHTLEYWLKGDGWKDNRGNYDMIGCSTSKSLALSMRDLAWSCGKYASIRKNKRSRYGIPNKDQYWVHIRDDFRSGDRLKYLSEFEFGSKTVNITKSTYIGDVYNLQVAEDESFVADGIVVHNCLFAMMMPLWVVTYTFKNLKTLKKQTEAILNCWTTGNQPLTEIVAEQGGFVPRSLRNKTSLPKPPNWNPIVSKNMQDPNGNYLWLLSGSR